MTGFEAGLLIALVAIIGIIIYLIVDNVSTSKPKRRDKKEDTDGQL